MTGAGAGSPGAPTLSPTKAYSTFHPYESSPSTGPPVPGPRHYVLQFSTDPSFPIITAGPVRQHSEPHDDVRHRRPGGRYSARVFAVSADGVRRRALERRQFFRSSSTIRRPAARSWCRPRPARRRRCPLRSPGPTSRIPSPAGTNCRSPGLRIQLDRGGRSAAERPVPHGAFADTRDEVLARALGAGRQLAHYRGGNGLVRGAIVHDSHHPADAVSVTSVTQPTLSAATPPGSRCN